MSVPSARKSIDTIRELISSPPDKKSPDGNSLYLTIHHLLQRSEEITKDPSLLADVLEAAEEISKFRGKGSQNAARTISQLFSLITMLQVNGLPESDTTFVSFAEAERQGTGKCGQFPPRILGR